MDYARGIMGPIGNTDLAPMDKMVRTSPQAPVCGLVSTLPVDNKRGYKMEHVGQLYRFHDTVAIWLKTGETVYLHHNEAVDLAQAIRECCLDIRTQKFYKSSFAIQDIVEAHDSEIPDSEAPIDDSLEATK